MSADNSKGIDFKTKLGERMDSKELSPQQVYNMNETRNEI